MAAFAGLPLEEFFSPFWHPPSGQAAGAGLLTGSAQPPAGAPEAGGGAAPHTRTIPVDFIERDAAYVLRADIPGVHKGEIRVTADGQVVRFGHLPHPDREQMDEKETGIFHRAERVSTFQGRALRLPGNADCDQIQAFVQYEDGVLEIVVAKKKLAEEEKTEGRRITIA